MESFVIYIAIGVLQNSIQIFAKDMGITGRLSETLCQAFAKTENWNSLSTSNLSMRLDSGHPCFLPENCGKLKPPTGSTADIQNGKAAYLVIRGYSSIKLVGTTQRTKEPKQRTQWEETQKLTALNADDENFAISKTVQDAVEVAKRQFGDRLSKSSTLADIITGTSKLLNDTERLATFVTTPKYAMGVSNFVSDLYVLVKTNGLYLLEPCISKISEIGQLAGNFKLDQDAWVKPLFAFTVFLREVEKFYRFLSDIRIRLSQFDVQSEKSLYNVQNIKDWGMPSKPQGISVSQDTFDDFVDKASTSFNLSDPDKVLFANLRDEDVWQINILHLNLLLQLALDTTQRCETLDDSIICRGPFIFASEFESSESSQINNLYIIASHSLFLDSNLTGTMFNTDYGVHMTLISQNWFSINQSTVNLTPRENTYKLPQADEGIDGKPGSFGWNCRNFFGASEYFHGDVNIMLNGGRGGEGQQGGQGNKSERMSKTLYNFYKEQVQWEELATPVLIDEERGKGYPCIAGRQQNILGYPDFLKRYPIDKKRKSVYLREDVQQNRNDPNSGKYERILLGSKYDWEFKYEGKLGGPGANGGRGGLGGLPGQFHFNQVGTTFDLKQIKVLNHTGELGEVGAGGQGAQTNPPWGNFVWLISYMANLKDCQIWNWFLNTFKYPSGCDHKDCTVYQEMNPPYHPSTGVWKDPSYMRDHRDANPYECCQFDGYMRKYAKEINKKEQGPTGKNGTAGRSSIEQNDTRAAFYAPTAHLKGLSLFKSYVFLSQTIFSHEVLIFVKQLDGNEDLVKLYTMESVYEEIKTFLSESGSYNILKRYSSSLDSLSRQLTARLMDEPKQIQLIALHALLHAVETNLMFDFNQITPRNFSQLVEEEQLFVDSIKTTDTSGQLLQLVKKTVSDLNSEALSICLENLNVTSMLSLGFEFDAFYSELESLIYIILDLAKNPEGNAKILREKRGALRLLMAKFPYVSDMKTSGRVANFLAILNYIHLLVLPLYKDPNLLNNLSDSGTTTPLLPSILVNMIQDEAAGYSESINKSMTGLRQKMEGLQSIAVACRYCVSVADKLGQSKAEFDRFNGLLAKKLARFEENIIVNYANVFSMYIESKLLIRKLELRLVKAIQADIANVVIHRNTTDAKRPQSKSIQKQVYESESKEVEQLRDLLSIVNIPVILYHFYVNNAKALTELASSTDANVLQASTSFNTLILVKNSLSKASHQYEACVTALFSGNSVSFENVTTIEWGINHLVGHFRQVCDRYLANTTKTPVYIAEYALILDHILPSLEHAFTKYRLLLEVKLVSNNVYAVISREKRSKDGGYSTGEQLDVNRIKEYIGTTVLKTRSTFLLKSLDNVIFPLSIPYRLGPINSSMSGVPMMATLKDAIIEYEAFLLNVRKSIKEYEKETEGGENLVHIREINLHTWKYYMFPKNIESLMQGKRVFLHSNIISGLNQYDAVKTRKLWLKITPPSGDTTDSQNVQKILQGLYLEIEYYGLSAYRVQNKYVFFKTMRETYRRLLQDDETGRPFGCNTLCSEMYEKVSLRSPYNLLQVQLVSEKGSNAFEQLAQYKNADVSLMGDVYATNISWNASWSEPYKNEHLPLYSIIPNYPSLS